MTNISNYPLQDNFKTTLSQQWDGATGTVYVASTPSFTFPAGITTYIVASPGKSTMQIARINAYNSSAKTLTVSNITLNKGASVASTAQTHSVGSEIIISDNFQFWSDIATAVNSKVDGDVQGFPSYTTSGRDALTASNGMMIYNTTTGEFNMYQGGSWVAISSGSTQPDASTTVAGKVEIATSAETLAGTDTGGTGAKLVALPSNIAANIQSSVFVYTASASVSDTYTANLTPAITAYTTGMQVRINFTTANTGACTINLNSLGAKSIKTRFGNDPQDGDIAASSIRDLTYDGTNFVLDVNKSTTAEQGIIEIATSAEALTGTDAERAMCPSTTKDSIKDSIGVYSTILSSTSNSADTGDITASTSGFVTIALSSSGASARATAALTYGSASPSTGILSISTSDGSSITVASVSWPVKKGYHYRVVTTGVNSTNGTTVYFTPNA